MITPEKVIKCAQAIVNSMNLKRGEAVLIRGGTHAQELLEEIGLLCYKQGAVPLINSTSDDFRAKIYESSEEVLKITSKYLLGAVKE